jgi:SNF2 family DNA or RNA helicase
VKPYPFQQEAINKLTQPKITSRLIGDEMGLGKTVTAIGIDLKNRVDLAKQDEKTLGRIKNRKTLIIAPLAVTESWVRHLEKLAPSGRVVLCNPKNRDDFVKALKEPYHYYVCHWEGMRLMAKELGRVHWFHIIADEVHRAKNRKAQTTRALKSLSSDYKTGCSGTPADDMPLDLWSILNWLWPKYYSSYWRFVKHYAVFDETANWGNGQTYRKFVGVQNAQSLHEEMKPWFVRRLKDEVLTDLPDKVYTDIWVELDPKQRKAYKEMEADMITWVESNQDKPIPVMASVVIAQLTRLQQFALGYMQWNESKNVWTISDPSAKIDALMEVLEDHPNKQFVVFSQFKGVLNLLGQRLTRAKIPHGLYTGDVKKADRDKLVDDFQAGKVRVFMGTIAAGGEGITLTAASTVVFLDRSWKPSKNRQAEDRCHRIGQKDTVNIIDIMAKDTVDLGRRQRINMKWSWIKEILGDSKKVQKEAESWALDLSSVKSSKY